MKVTVIGAGNSGLAMAAHMSREGHEVTLWNRTEATVKTLMKTRLIHSEGMIEGHVPLHKVTCHLDEALEKSELILITTPANAHWELGCRIGRSIQNEPLILLNPGRTFGALEFQIAFESVNPKLQPLIAEAQTIIYTCRKTEGDRVHILALKSDVLLSTFHAESNEELIASLPECLQQYFIPASSMIETSIGNVGMILHSAPLLLNAGWTENESNIYRYYYDGITPTVSAFLEKIDAERVRVSKALGHPVETTRDWMRRTYKIEGETLFECLQNNEAYQRIEAPTTLLHRYIFEDVSTGLVPLEAVGKNLRLDMQYTTLVIDLASLLMDTDFRKVGRNLDSLGLSSGTLCLHEILEGRVGHA